MVTPRRAARKERPKAVTLDTLKYERDFPNKPGFYAAWHQPTIVQSGRVELWPIDRCDPPGAREERPMTERTETPEQRQRERARYGRVRRAGLMERCTASASAISFKYHSWADKNGNSCELRLAAMIERALVALADDLMEGTTDDD